MSIILSSKWLVRNDRFIPGSFHLDLTSKGKFDGYDLIYFLIGPAIRSNNYEIFL